MHVDFTILPAFLHSCANALSELGQICTCKQPPMNFSAEKVPQASTLRSQPIFTTQCMTLSCDDAQQPHDMKLLNLRNANLSICYFCPGYEQLPVNDALSHQSGWLCEHDVMLFLLLDEQAQVCC